MTDAIVSDLGADSFTVQRMGITQNEDDFERQRNNPLVTVDDADAIKRFSDSVAAVMAQGTQGAPVAYRTEELESVRVQGVSEEYLEFATFDAERGRMISPIEIERNRPVALLGWGTADRLFGLVGSARQTDPRRRRELPRRRRERKEGRGVRQLAGRVRGDSARLVSEAVRHAALAGADGQAARPVAWRRSPRTKCAPRSAIERRLKPAEPDNFGIVASDSVLGIFQQATAGIAVVLVGIVGLSLLVGGIVIMNIMLMVVSERTREIGLRKALGAKRRDIMSQVLTESITLSICGGIIGIAPRRIHLLHHLEPDAGAVVGRDVVGGARRRRHGGGRAVLRLLPGASRRHARSDRSAAPGIAAVSLFTKQFALLFETADMALGTLRANKMRSALTVLGVVIGVTSIVGMTSLIRGFDTSLRDSINALGPKTIFVQRFGALSFSGASFMELIRRPVLTVDDGEAIRRLAPSVAMVDIWLGAAPPQPTMERVFYRGERTRPAAVIGSTERFVEINFAKMLAGRMFTEQEVARRRAVMVIGYGPYAALFEAARHRSGWQGRAARRRRVHDCRRHGQASGRGRLRPRTGRLRADSVHGVPAAVRLRESPPRTVRRHAAA